MAQQIFGNRYRLLERIGEGGMAYVYLAIDEKLGRKVAVKVLHEHMEKNPDIRKRFQMEAQAISSLDHPNIVNIYDYSGDNSGRLWIVTEVIRGQNLADYVQYIRGTNLNPFISICIVREILKALDHAHNHKIVHRDIKPENVMVTHDGRIKLMDFGIAKDMGQTGMTVTGTFMGSPSYMSPEQIRGRDVDNRSDIYSISVLLYEILTGRLPFIGQTTHEVVMKIMDGVYTFPKFINPNIPMSIDTIVVKGMAKEVIHRFQSVGDYALAIDGVLKEFKFNESHVELERYFKDPNAYLKWLEKKSVANSSTIDSAPASKIRLKIKTTSNNGSEIRNRRQTDHGFHPDQQALTQKDGVPIKELQEKSQSQSRVLAPRHGGRRSGVVENQGKSPSNRTNLPPNRQDSENKEESRQEVPLPARPVREQDASKKSPLSTGTSSRFTSDYGPTEIVPSNVRIPAKPDPQRTLQSNDQVNFQQANHANQVARLQGAPSPPLVSRQHVVPAAIPQQIRRPNQPQQAVRQEQRRQVNHQMRPVPKVWKEANWGSQFFGVVWIGILIFISFWGYLQLHEKIQAANQTKNQAINSAVNSANNPSKNNGLDTDAKHRLGGGKTIRSSANRTNSNDRIVQNKQKNVVDVGRPLLKPTEPISPGRLARDIPAKVNDNIATISPHLTKSPRKANLAKDDHKGARLPLGDTSTNTEVYNSKSNRQATQGVQSNPPVVEVPVENIVQSKPDAKGRVSLSSQPAADIYIDGAKVGTTIDATTSSGWISLSVGTHSIELKRQGYMSQKLTATVTADGQEALPKVELLPLGDAQKGNEKSPTPSKSQGVSLTIKVSMVPAQVSIRNLETNGLQSFLLKTLTKTVTLDPSRYNVRVEFQGNVKERDFVINGSQGSLTFFADFNQKLPGN